MKLVPISKDKLAKSVETIQGLAPYLGGCARAPESTQLTVLAAPRRWFKVCL